MNKTFGEWLRTKRQDKFLTLEEFSDRCGISRVSLSKFENDQRVPGMKSQMKLAHALDMHYLELRDVLDEKEQMKHVNVKSSE